MHACKQIIPFVVAVVIGSDANLAAISIAVTPPRCAVVIT